MSIEVIDERIARDLRDGFEVYDDDTKAAAGIALATLIGLALWVGFIVGLFTGHFAWRN